MYRLTVKRSFTVIFYTICVIFVVRVWEDNYAWDESSFVTLRQIINNGSETVVRVRLLCFLMTDPSVLHMAVYARDTWMKRCDISLFMSSAENKSFPTVGLNVSAGRDFIAKKAKASWKYVYEHFRDKADFFMKADPDSYVAVEILKEYLKNCNSSEPEIYGHNMYIGPQRPYGVGPYRYSGHYVAGEAEVLTKEALVRVVTRGMSDPKCLQHGQAEDLKICSCLMEVGGYVVDTRNQFGKDTFLPPLPLDTIVMGKYNERAPWYIAYRAPYGHCPSVECLSDHPIAFHYVKGNEFFMLDYLFRIRLRLIQQLSIDLSHLKFNGTRYTKNT